MCVSTYAIGKAILEAGYFKDRKDARKTLSGWVLTMLPLEEENVIAKELLEMLAGKEISVRKARWILRKAEEMPEDTPMQKPEE